MSTWNFLCFWKWLPLTSQLFTRKKAQRNNHIIAHNFLVLCRTKQRNSPRLLSHCCSRGGTSCFPLGSVCGECGLWLLSAPKGRQTPRKPPEIRNQHQSLASLPCLVSSLQIPCCSFSQEGFLPTLILVCGVHSIAWVSRKRSIASQLPLWRCLFHIWNVFMCTRSALTCRRRKKVVLLEAKQPPVKTNCVGRGLLVSLGGIQQEESKCSKSTRKSPVCQADPLHQSQDWNIPSDWWPVLRRPGWGRQQEGGVPWKKNGAVRLSRLWRYEKDDKCDRLDQTSSLKADMWCEWSLVTFKQKLDVWLLLRPFFLHPHQVFLFKSQILRSWPFFSSPFSLIPPVYFTQVFLAMKRPRCPVMERQESMMQATFCHHLCSSLNRLPTSWERAGPLGPRCVPTSKHVASVWTWRGRRICDWSFRWWDLIHAANRSILPVTLGRNQS